MTTETPNYLSAEQERVINDFQRVAREIMGDEINTITTNVRHDQSYSFVHAQNQCFMSNNVSHDLAPSLNDAIHQLRTTIKSPAEQAQIDYDRAVKDMEEAKAKLDALS